MIQAVPRRFPDGAGERKESQCREVPARRYEMTKPGVPSRPGQSTPLMVDGVLYLSIALATGISNCSWSVSATNTL